ncbi:MAG TPA: hypothetical protein VGS61_05880, partial [Acidimicrobiales bacterium]|nr:hypothetical protein [Acidimicrobiales bacterium]
MTSRRWIGHAWIAAAALALALVPASPGSAATVSESNLMGVDCVGPHACLAVGDALARQVVPLAEHFNGSAWSVVPVGKLGAEAKLAGVSCPTAAWCAVVGGNGDGSL